MDGGGDMPPGGGLHRRIAGVAAGTHHQIRPERADDGVRLMAGGHQRFGGLEVVPQPAGRQGAVEIADLHRGEIVAGLLHKAALHAVGGAHKQHADGGVLRPHISRQRQRRIHMSGGAAAGKNHIHSRCSFYPLRGAGICRETLNTMPISTSCRASAVPP